LWEREYTARDSPNFRTVFSAFRKGDELHCSENGVVVKRARIATIIPVLVHLDNALRTPGIPAYVKINFRIVRNTGQRSPPMILVGVVAAQTPVLN
jgi:hypothetical protein